GGTAGASAGGMSGTGGVGGQAGGMSGTGGGGGLPPSCMKFPSGTSLIAPTDGRLHCYWAHGNQIDWNSAETVCETEGGTLVTILSEAENAAVVQLAIGTNLFMGLNMSGQVFIGATDGKDLNDRSGPGDYAWVTGEAWGYENWHDGQPDGACMNCGSSGFGCSCDHRGAIASDGTWYDRTETTMRPFICEAIAP
ncbi:MAG TPA: C-type lectin domain-containing protein, partial [Trebonia sp.]|nr:C-type lectin domain-containing protein [Trebonia sp.]